MSTHTEAFAFDGTYYDGRTSQGRPVRITLTTGQCLELRGRDFHVDVPADQVTFSPRLGNTPRYLRFSDGDKCETFDNDAVDAMQRVLGTGSSAHFIFHLESRMKYVLIAVVVTVAMLWGSIQYGIPWLAEGVTHAMPIEIERKMGEESLATLDAHFFAPSKLSEADRLRAQAVFDRVLASVQMSPSPTVTLRHGGQIGANALALPSGFIIVTDELVTLAQSDEELFAVVAHEVGHVRNRHIMRQILQNSAAALLVAVIIGDLGSLASLSATLPTFLLEQSYSRAFEYEADAFAADVLRANDMRVGSLGDILRKIAQSHGTSESGWEGYLSTHPATEDRIEALDDP